VDVVGHEAVGQDLHSVLFALGFQQRQVSGVIFLLFEDSHGADAPLGDVVGNAG